MIPVIRHPRNNADMDATSAGRLTAVPAKPTFWQRRDRAGSQRCRRSKPSTFTAQNTVNWFERICSIVDVIIWVLLGYVVQTIMPLIRACIRACIRASSPVFIRSFINITVAPLMYGLTTCHGCEGRDCSNYVAGFGTVVLVVGNWKRRVKEKSRIHVAIFLENL